MPRQHSEAIEGLGNLGTDIALKALYISLGDEEESVRKLASNHLRKISEEKEFDSLSHELENSDPVIQNQALDLIAIRRGEKWIRLLEKKTQAGLFKLRLAKKAVSILETMRVTIDNLIANYEQSLNESNLARHDQ